MASSICLIAALAFLCVYCDATKKTMLCEWPGDVSENGQGSSATEQNYVPRRMLEICDVFYDGKCFALLMSTARMNLVDAKAACRGVQGVPANIYSEEHFEKMRALLRSRIYISHHYNHVWTGMTVDTSRRTILKRDGTKAPYIRWVPGRPYNPARVHVGFHVEGDPNSGHQGLFDEHGSYRLLGVLCEI